MTASDDRILHYYQKELAYLHGKGKIFSQHYPNIAKSLDFNEHGSDDPHVQRLIESFAFLAGRLHARVDDQFSDFTQNILDILYPHFISPVPSCALIQFQPLSKEKSVYTLPRHTRMSAASKEGPVCWMRTTHDLHLTSAQVENVQILSHTHHALPHPLMLHITLKNVMWRKGASMTLGLDTNLVQGLRLWESIMTFDDTNMPPLYHVDSTVYTSLDTQLHPVGFDENESLFPYAPSVHVGYRILFDAFVYPQKFLFFHVYPLPQWSEDTITLAFPLNPQGPIQPKHTVKCYTNTGTIVNIFPKTCEPLRLNHKTWEYRISPHASQENYTEIYSIDQVFSLKEKKPVCLPPYFMHHTEHSKTSDFWVQRRSPSIRMNTQGTDVFLSFVNQDMEKHTPACHTLYVKALCTNRNLAQHLNTGTVFDVYEDIGLQGTLLEKPTTSFVPALEAKTQWVLLSHLSMAHRGWYDKSDNGLFHLLGLYEKMVPYSFFTKEIGTLNIKPSQHTMGLMHTEAWRGFRPLIQTDIHINADHAAPGSFFLTRVLAQFLGYFCPINQSIQIQCFQNNTQHPIKIWQHTLI